MRYEAHINGVRVVATPDRNFTPDRSFGTSHPGFTVAVDGGPVTRLQIEHHESFGGNCIGSDACNAFIEQFLLHLGFAMVPDPAPTKCEHCGAPK